MKFQFSGHETFICKHFWLKKGYDFILGKNGFSDENAVIELGVGKNMVSSISYWLKAFGILDMNNEPSELAKKIFDENGYDPYLEDIATIWLLQYSLVKTNKASLYHLFFNEFRKTRVEFTKDQFLNYVLRVLEDAEQKNTNKNTITADIIVFIRNYLKPAFKESNRDIEEEYASLLIDLDLIRTYKSENIDGQLVDWYSVESKVQTDLPPEIVLFLILEHIESGNYSRSISFKELMIGENSPGMIFCLNEEGLYGKLERITAKYKGITFSESAGIRELQIRTKQTKWEILHDYYKG
jgi:hypothetical protein